MTLFGHTIEYTLPYIHEKAGIEVKTAIISYVNLFDINRKYSFTAPNEMWSSVKIGGTMSNNNIFTTGLVEQVLPPRHKVITADGPIYCHALPLDQHPIIGDQVIVFDHMQHSVPGRYGEFLPAALVSPSKALVEQLNLHSINIIVFNNNDQIGTIHIDPFTNTANYDNFNLLLKNGDRWISTDFKYHD